MFITFLLAMFVNDIDFFYVYGAEGVDTTLFIFFTLCRGYNYFFLKQLRVCKKELDSFKEYCIKWELTVLIQKI